TIDEKLTQARERRPAYVTPSLAKIARINANAAMPHYRATQAEQTQKEGEGKIFIDSGGQNLGPPTDNTRMVANGTPT
ncbi:M24 family metallopeptidase, partial [Pseudomonas syringae group genomosp. 7]|uniref:M24 family metallopeptidase n=1 Tax=Pseudomonas syringae group genomosp. 7 TaxID=251699 RepID=UPI0037704E03